MLLVQFIDMSGIEQARDNRALKSLFHFHNDQVWKSLLSETVDHKTGPVVDDREKKYHSVINELTHLNRA